MCPFVEQGLRATDVQGMRELGVSLPAVASLISEAFCEQVRNDNEKQTVEPLAIGRPASQMLAIGCKIHASTRR